MSKSGCDVLISIGGGSPIDSAKAIAYNIHQETGKWIPSIAVPTTLSVAETTQNAGFTTEEKAKIAVSDPELVPKGKSLPGFKIKSLTLCSCCLRRRHSRVYAFEPLDQHRCRF
jgi:hypothetical protein